MRYSARLLTTAGMLTALAVSVEILDGVLPGAGIFLGGFSTLFVALAGKIKPIGGILTFIASAMLIAMLMPAQLPIFLLNRGLLGLSLGLTMQLGKKLSILISSLAFTLGSVGGAWLFGLPLLPAFETSFGPALILLVLIYSLFFSWLWFLVLGKITKRFHAQLPNI